MVRIPHCCNHDPETTVLAHYRLAGLSGMGMKGNDFACGAWACSACHDVIDRRAYMANLTGDEVKLMHAEGVMRTQAQLLREGVIVC